MKVFTFIAAAIIATTSFSSLAAQEINSKQANQFQSIGIVSVSGINGSPSDVDAALNAKAVANGAKHYRVIGMSTPGDSSDYIASAEIYN
ncbi:DUF1471 domain-containing protein [Yersinia ruckeri]|uniref:Putative exported protein n=1 Tax=Yersinia ruckeri TaxID=29486 RepID=A0A085U549_YERRU|nr:DUF1471 domain-containing protein [Yersinia ruckeri]AKA39432.1 hypothetical protein UGYR_14255 [Yersinia ruckeri]ARZ02048.1 biofilm stress and motility protein A [Yersinia ruckeri]AUQ40759.1 DUF1471 domain-containing protein [Yersinia ruckeri]EEP99038.1 hypothetical protein yruck0001_23010 [Yersinia ruckeri ATCC 29473]EKN4183274.1 DUF1471 domain-containing protein [Yersinia ruckeri]